MADWDEDSPAVRRNLAKLLKEIAHAARQRVMPSVELARGWQRGFMEGLDADPRFVGRFRGAPGLENIQVRIGGRKCLSAVDVRNQLRRFENPRADEGYAAAAAAGKAMQGVVLVRASGFGLHELSKSF